MADATLPIVNAIDNLKESNKDQRERLQKSMRAGLLNVVKSIERLGSNLGRLSSVRSQIADPQQELLSSSPETSGNEPHFIDKLSTWFEFQTSQGANKIAELESRNREQGKTILQLNERVVNELVPALNHLKEEITKLVRYTRLQIKQTATGTGIQVTERMQTLNKRLGEFDELSSFLKEQQTHLRESHNQYAVQYYQPIIDEVREKLDDMKRSMAVSADLEERAKLRNVYTASMNLIKSLDKNEQALNNSVNENTEAVEETNRKLDKNTRSVDKNTSAGQLEDQETRKLFRNIFSNRGPLYNIFADIKEGNSRIRKWMREKWEGEGNNDRGGLGAVSTTISLLSNPLVWKAALAGFLLYGTIKGQQNIADAMGRTSVPEYEKKKSLAEKAAAGDQEAKKQLRIELYGTDDPEEALFRKKYGKLGVMLRDWWKSSPASPPAGAEEFPDDLIEGSSPVQPQGDEGPSWWQKLLGIGDAGAADIQPSARPGSVETTKGMEGFKVMKRSAEQSASSLSPIIIDTSTKVGDSNTTAITNNQNTFAPIEATSSTPAPSNTDNYGRPK